MKKIFSFVCVLVCAMSLNAAVTYNVTVPAGTNTCYIAGNCTGWGFTQMTKVDDTHYTITLDTDNQNGYKYCSGPDWAYVEKDADGNEIKDRTYSANDEVARWASVYNPGATVSYVDIIISVKAETAPNIWWWGAGDKCPNADQTKDAEGNAYNWETNHPVMTAVAGQTGWFEWVFKDVNASLGVTFKLNKEKQITATESTCYNESGEVINCPATAISNTEVKAAYTKIIRDGQVLIVREGKTFDMMGQQVF